MAPRSKKGQEPQTTGQRLGSLIKSCRDIMRKDKGLNGDLDRLPQLTWILFLKFLDDLAQQDEVSADLAGDEHQPLIPPPYRWRDWAAHADGMTGDELLAFISNDEAVRPDGTRGPGLFAMLRGLQGAEGGDRRDVIARVFSGTNNRMINGYLIRDVVNKVDGIHFSSTDELHTLSALYEGMLREMRDAAGDSGEFYTPRPVVRLMVELTNPQLGETVLDPACGTGGFLVEAYEHMKKQVRTTPERELLQRRTLFGGEAKSLPYLLAEMNLLLHGVEVPNVEFCNSLAVKLTEIGDRERVDVILTNPPFGGEEESSIKANFPATLQTSETALLFLQLIMRKLKRPVASGAAGRAAVVVPDGTLFADGLCARIKEQLLKEFNLHTIVRLPPGVFEPYTNIPTNLLFFDRTGPTESVWFWQHQLPPGRRQYTKTEPLRSEEFQSIVEWWEKREPTESAWNVGVDELLQRTESGEVLCNLDRRHPSSSVLGPAPGPEDLLESLTAGLRDALSLLSQAQAVFAQLPQVTTDLTPIKAVLIPKKHDVLVEPSSEYRFAGVKSFGRGVFHSRTQLGAEFSYRKLGQVHAGDLTYGKLMAWEGGVGIVPSECDGCFVSPEYPIFSLRQDHVLPNYLSYLFRSPAAWSCLKDISQGTNVRRRRVHPSRFLQLCLPLPTLDQQRLVVRAFTLLDEALEAIPDEVVVAQLSETVWNRLGSLQVAEAPAG